MSLPYQLAPLHIITNKCRENVQKKRRALKVVFGWKMMNTE
ncbi:hypothetical protein B4168_1375 [Anoxybacillus flavithermus]|nr:hypothetical protein B4168_1375 [Anoxybacillus flavithermus]